MKTLLRLAVLALFAVTFLNAGTILVSGSFTDGVPVATTPLGSTGVNYRIFTDGLNPEVWSFLIDDGGFNAVVWPLGNPTVTQVDFWISTNDTSSAWSINAALAAGVPSAWTLSYPTSQSSRMVAPVGQELDGGEMMGFRWDIVQNPNVKGSAVVDWSVQFTTTDVPEPGTIGLMGAGLALVGFAARRRK
jgi:hypothetical protein